MKALGTVLAAVLAGFVLTGCATQRAVDGPQEINDPFERFNRAMFKTTLALDKVVVRRSPLSTAPSFRNRSGTACATS